MTTLVWIMRLFLCHLTLSDDLSLRSASQPLSRTHPFRRLISCRAERIPDLLRRQPRQQACNPFGIHNAGGLRDPLGLFVFAKVFSVEHCHEKRRRRAHLESYTIALQKLANWQKPTSAIPWRTSPAQQDSIHRIHSVSRNLRRSLFHCG